MNETTHKTMADVIDQKILTEENGRRFRKTIKIGLIAFAAVMSIDIISFIVCITAFGLPA